MNKLRMLIVVCALLTLAACASATTGQVHGVNTPAAAAPSDDCQVGSVDYALPARPPTVATILNSEPADVSIAVMDIGQPEGGRYDTPDGLRLRQDENIVFNIYTPWHTTLVKQLAGKTPPMLYADGGSVGCDELARAYTWSLQSGTRALVISMNPPEGFTPAGWKRIGLTWRVVGDRVLIPQPPKTIGREFKVEPAKGIEYNGERHDGSSISLAALEAFMQSDWHLISGPFPDPH